MGNGKKFAVWTILVSYLYAGLYYFVFPYKSQTAYLIMAVLYMWFPALVAMILTKKEGGRIRDLAVRLKPNKWFVFAWLIFPVLTFITIIVNSGFPGAEFSLHMTGYFEKYKDLLSPEQYQRMYNQATNTPWVPLTLMIVQGLFAGLTINLAAAFGEELGWRGYLYQAFDSLGFWRKSLWIGVIWGFWHAPLIMQGHNYPGYPVIGVFLMTLWCVLLSPVFTLIREKSGSVIAASIAHGTLNAVGGISLLYIKGGSTLINGIVGISGCIVLVFVNIGIWYYMRKQISQATTALKTAE